MQKLTQILEQEIRSAGIPGAALVAWKNGARYEAVAGVASVEHPAPVTVDTPFRIGSTTKSLTTAAILATAPDLDAPLPWGMTLRHLLSHTGGMPADPITPGNLYGPVEPEALTRWARALPGDCKPGAWQYSNPGFALAAHVVEEATGEPIADLVDRHVLRPLGMTHTSWHLADVVTWAPAQCHRGAPAAVVRPAFDNAVYAAAGFAYSSAADLATFLARVPEPMTVRQVDTVDEELDGYGLGLYVEQARHSPLRPPGRGRRVRLSAPGHSGRPSRGSPRLQLATPGRLVVRRRRLGHHPGGHLLMTDPRTRCLARTLLDYSLEVRAGETVLICSTGPAGEPLVRDSMPSA